MKSAAVTKYSQYRHIAENLKQQIATGYNVGDLLASETELASQFGVTRKTIREAMDILVENGLIRRHQGRGSVVVDPILTGEFVIISHPNTFAVEASAYWRCAIMSLVEELRRRNKKLRISIRLEHEEDGSGDSLGLTDFLEPHVLNRLRAVFSFTYNKEVEEALQTNGVPVVSLTSDSKYAVLFDYTSLANIAVEKLHAAGCRSMGILCGHYTPESYAWQVDTTIRKKAAELGIVIRPEWIPNDENDYIVENSGVRMFERFWSFAKHPDALMIVDDMLCRGALRAISAAGLDIPRDLKVITHANTGVGFPYHKQISRIEFDSLKQVRIAVDMMMELLAGREPATPKVMLSGEYVAGETI